MITYRKALLRALTSSGPSMTLDGLVKWWLLVVGFAAVAWLVVLAGHTGVARILAISANLLGLVLLHVEAMRIKRAGD